MIKPLLATALSAALAFAAPSGAQAGDADDLARALAGAVALGIIAHALTDGGASASVTYRSGGYGHGGHVRSGGTRVITGTPVHRLAVPASCARRIATTAGYRTFFGQPCLSRSGVNTAYLPNRCERILDLPGHNVRAWNRACLLNAGVRIR